MRRTLLLSLLLLLPWMGKASIITVNNGYIYLILDTSTKKAKLASNPNKYSGDLTIPETITYDNDIYTVVAIGWRSLQNCTGLTSVNIPNSVTTIEDEAFSGCKGLVSMEIPSCITTLGSSVFSGCTGLTTFTIPANITSLGDGLLSNCTGLTQVTILSNAQGGANTFHGCSNLKDVIFDCENAYPYFKSNTVIEKVTFGDHVKSISDKAFYYCSNLKTVNLSNSVERIGSNAFYDCEGLTTITIPNGISFIGKDAFSYCNSLSEVCISDLTAWCNIVFENPWACPLVCGKKLVLNGEEIVNLVIPDGVTTIHIGAFANGVNFQSITIPGSVNAISDYAFDGCEKVKSLALPEGVTTIGSYAFEDCSALETITMPASLTSIGSKAFNNCKSLKRVNVADIGAWSEIQFGGEYANPFYYSKSFYFNNELVNELVIPEGVKVIKGYAFERCQDLVSITFPSSLTEIENYAFLYDENIAEIICFADIPPAMSQHSFYGVSKYKIDLYVHESAKESYLNDYWWKSMNIHSIPDSTPAKCAKPTISYENGKFVFECETEGVEFISQVMDANVKAHASSRISLEPVYVVSVFARLKGSEDSDVTTAEFRWENNNPKITYVK